MKEILGYNLKQFFDNTDPKYKEAEINFANSEYEVWEVSDELFKTMCDMNEEEFEKFAGDEAWWRSSEGTILGVPNCKFEVNERTLIGWDSPIYDSKIGREYKNLTDYLCNCIGVSTERNVCACAVDLAKYNDITMAELFARYEGMGDYDVEM